MSLEMALEVLSLFSRPLIASTSSSSLPKNWSLDMPLLEPNLDRAMLLSPPAYDVLAADPPPLLELELAAVW